MQIMIFSKAKMPAMLRILQILLIFFLACTTCMAGIPEVTEDMIFKGIDRVAANGLKLGAQNGVEDVIRSAFMGLEEGIKASKGKDAAAFDMAGWINFVVSAVMLDDLKARGVSQNNPKLPKVGLAQAQKDVQDMLRLVATERFKWDNARFTRNYSRAYGIVQRIYLGGRF